MFGQQKPFNVPVQIVVIRVLGKNQRLWDYSSVLRGNWKEIEDALVACGFLHDDGPDYVKLVIGVQETLERERGPCVDVLFLRSGTSSPSAQEARSAEGNFQGLELTSMP